MRDPHILPHLFLIVTFKQVSNNKHRGDKNNFAKPQLPFPPPRGYQNHQHGWQWWRLFRIEGVTMRALSLLRAQQSFANNFRRFFEGDQPTWYIWMEGSIFASSATAALVTRFGSQTNDTASFQTAARQLSETVGSSVDCKNPRRDNDCSFQPGCVF